MPRISTPHDAPAATARSRYWPTLKAEKWGASTSPTARPKPSAARPATAASIVGSACFMPSTTW